MSSRSTHCVCVRRLPSRVQALVSRASGAPRDPAEGGASDDGDARVAVTATVAALRRQAEATAHEVMAKRRRMLTRLGPDGCATVTEVVDAIVDALVGYVERGLGRHVDGCHRQRRQIDVLMELFALDGSVDERW